MKHQLIRIVLPQLARRLQPQVQAYRDGELSDSQFARKFEGLLQHQYAWLAKRGVPQAKAAVAVHGAVLVLTSPALRAEAEELKLPLEVIEYRALRAAAADIAQNYGVSELRTFRQLAAIVSQYGD
jgi:hypothetical protein